MGIDALEVAGTTLEQQVIALGVAAIVKDSDAPTQFWTLKGSQNIIERGIVTHLEVAEAFCFGCFESRGFEGGGAGKGQCAV